MEPKNKREIFLAACLFFLCSAIYGQQKLTLEACREMALKYNKAGAIAEKNEEKTNYESKSYRANFLPKISASGMYLYTNSVMNKTISENYLPTYVLEPSTGKLAPNILTTPDGNLMRDAKGNPIFKEYAYFPEMNLNFQLNGTYIADIRAEQPIFTGGKITSAYKMSQTGKDIARLNKNLIRTEIITRTDEAYWLHLKALETKKVALAFREVVNELFQNVQNAYQAGMKTKNDVLRVQVQVNKVELQLQQAVNAVRLSRMNLCQIIGLPLISDIAISETLDDDSRKDDADLAFTTDNAGDYTARPEYSILEKQIELKNRQIQLVRSDFLPNIGVMANYGYMKGLELNGTPLINRASFSALLSVRIPIFHWGEGMNKIRAAKVEKQILQLQREDLSGKMELEAQKALDKCEESKLEVSLTLRSLEQAEENMKISRNHYEAGMETLSNCLEAQTIWQQAWMELIQAKINRRLNETYFLKATGGL